MLGAQKRNFHMFTKLCGDDACKNVVLVTTRWRKADHGELREHDLRKKFWNEMLSRGSRMMRYEDSSQSAWDIINAIVERVPLEFVQLQRELVDLQLLLPETEAGKALRCELQELLDLHRRRMQELQREQTPDTEESYNETVQEIGKLVPQIQELTFVPLSKKIKRLLRIG
jgi:hypothetical protein